MHPTIDSHTIFLLFLELSLLVGVTRIGAELSKRVGMPAVVGEMLGGIALGPTLFGHYAPAAFAAVFPSSAEQLHLLDAFGTVGMSLLLLLTGLETDIRLLRNLGRAAFIASVMGMVLPFGLGFGLGTLMPAAFLTDAGHRTLFSLFLATAMSISAMPVIAKILVDLDLTKRNIGLVILSAGVVDDTVGWLILSLIAGAATHGAVRAGDLGMTVAYLGAFILLAAFVLLPILRVAVRATSERFKSTDSDLVLIIVVTFLCAAATERIGVHAVFGAFVAGVVLHQVPRLRKESVVRLESFTFAVLAPIFFGIVGLRVNLWALGGGGMLAAGAGGGLRRQAGRRFAGRLLGWHAVLGGGLDRRGDERARRDGDRGGDHWPLAGDPHPADVLDHRDGRDRDLLHRPGRLAADHAARPDDGGRGPANLGLRVERRLRSAVSLRVLLAAGGGANALAAAPLAIGLARKSSAAVRVLHVEAPRTWWQRLRHPFGRQAPVNVSDQIETMRALAKNKPLELAQATGPAIAAAICDEAKRGCDLIVIGSGDGPSIGGSVVEQVVAAAPCHVAIMKAPAAGGDYARVLVPVDGSLASRLAVELALRYAEATGAALTLALLTERRPQVAAYADLSGTHPLPAAPPANPDDELERISVVFRASPIKPSVIHLAFEPGSNAVAQAVEKGRYDLVVLGAENRAVQHRLFFGYENERLIRATRVPVVVVVPSLSRLAQGNA